MLRSAGLRSALTGVLVIGGAALLAGCGGGGPEAGGTGTRSGALAPGLSAGDLTPGLSGGGLGAVPCGGLQANVRGRAVTPKEEMVGDSPCGTTPPDETAAARAGR